MAQPRKSTKNAYLALFFATLALSINFWAWAILSPLGGHYESIFDLNPTTLSFLLAIPVLVGSLGRIILGALTDRYGGKAIFAITCFLTAIPVFCLTFAKEFPTLAIVAIFLGLGGAIFAVGVPYISAWFRPEQRGLMLGLYGIGDAGTALAAFFTLPLISGIGESMTFSLVAALLVVCGLIFVKWGKNSPSWKPSKGSFVRRLSTALKQPVTWDLSIIYAVTFGAFVAFGVYLPVLLKVAYGLSLTDAAMRAGGFILLATLARPLGGWISDKVGGKHVVRVSLLLIALLAGFVAVQPSLATSTTVAYLSLAFVLGACSGAVFALVGRAVKPGLIGGVTGVVGAIGGLGGFIPPLILGATYEQTGSYSFALGMLAISSAVVLIYMHRRFKNKKLYSYTP
ncbi:MAG: MFS transporter [Candidatus Saccharimonas sp.]